MAHDPPHGDPVIAAIERVLKVERDGVAALHRSEDDAQRMLAQARAQAAHIGQRVDASISRLHTAYLQKLDRHIRTLAAEQPSDGESEDAAYDHTRLAAAARRVAARLTGAA